MRKSGRGAGWALVFGLMMGCGPNSKDGAEKKGELLVPPSPVEERLEIRAGECIGTVCLGMTYAELLAEVGELEEARGYRRIILGRYSDLGIEVSLASPDEFVATPDALVVAVGTLEGTSFDGVILPGMSAAELVAGIGDTPADVAGKYLFLPTGMSVLTGDDGSVERVGIFASYTIRREPPAMIHASTTMPEGGTP